MYYMLYLYTCHVKGTYCVFEAINCTTKVRHTGATVCYIGILSDTLFPPEYNCAVWADCTTGVYVCMYVMYVFCDIRIRRMYTNRVLWYRMYVHQ